MRQSIFKLGFRIIFSALLVLFSAFIIKTTVGPDKTHYQNKTLNFSIDHPFGWTLEEDMPHSTVSFNAPEKDSLGQPLAMFYVHFVDWSAGMKEKEFEETLINSYYNEYNQVRISYKEKDNHCKKSWGMLELFVQKGIEPIKYIRTYYRYNPEGCIIISYQASAKQADKYKAIIESSIKSFKNKQ